MLPKVFGFALAVALWASTPGTFRGIVVHASQPGKWVYVRGPRGITRRVDLSQAKVIFGPSVPASAQSKDGLRSIAEGSEVRITAVQDGGGEWKATQVEVLKAPEK